MPPRIGSFPLHDPDGTYWGFAVSGYGLMWNTRYLALHKLPAPREWTDLADPRYSGHLVISAPSRSGTTHLTVEVILQAYGWEKGWGLLFRWAATWAPSPSAASGCRRRWSPASTASGW